MLISTDSLLRRRDLAEAIGAALVAKAAGQGYRKAAATAGAPVSTAATITPHWRSSSRRSASPGLDTLRTPTIDKRQPRVLHGVMPTRNETSLAKMTPLARAKEAARLMDGHRDAMSHLASIRAVALREMRDSGLSAVNIAEALGVSRQAVHRLLRESEEDDKEGTVSLSDVAKRLGVPLRAVLERIDAGDLPAVKIGPEIRVRPKDLPAAKAD